jgi:predicted esterase
VTAAVPPPEEAAAGEALLRSLPARVHGSFLVLPPAGGTPPRAAVVGFHGYGERADQHLAELRRLPGAERHLLCAVQALHPFYKKSGEVVASWMTRFDRERAIADNVAYVAGAVAALRAEFPSVERLAYAGFSQGVAMAYRAAAAAAADAGSTPAGGTAPASPGATGEAPAALLVLAGDVPPEIGPAALARLPPVLLAAGRADEWFGPAELERDAARLRGAGVTVEPLVLARGHQWADEFRARAGEFLARRLASG